MFQRKKKRFRFRKEKKRKERDPLSFWIKKFYIENENCKKKHAKIQINYHPVDEIRFQIFFCQILTERIKILEIMKFCKNNHMKFRWNSSSCVSWWFFSSILTNSEIMKFYGITKQKKKSGYLFFYFSKLLPPFFFRPNLGRKFFFMNRILQKI